MTAPTRALRILHVITAYNRLRLGRKHHVNLFVDLVRQRLQRHDAGLAHRRLDTARDADAAAAGVGEIERCAKP